MAVGQCTAAQLRELSTGLVSSPGNRLAAAAKNVQRLKANWLYPYACQCIFRIGE